MEKYELLYILPAKYTEAELNDLAEKIQATVVSLGGSAPQQHSLGRRKLAYPIKHVRNGNYFMIWFEADKASTAKINETLRLSADVLRHVIVKRDARLTKIPVFTEDEAAPRRDRDEQRRDDRPAMQQVPLKPTQDKVNIEQLDKKLDEMLTEDVM